MRDLTQSELDIASINSLRSRFNAYEDVGSLGEWICSDEWCEGDRFSGGGARGSVRLWNRMWLADEVAGEI